MLNHIVVWTKGCYDLYTFLFMAIVDSVKTVTLCSIYTNSIGLR